MKKTTNKKINTIKKNTKKQQKQNYKKHNNIRRQKNRNRKNKNTIIKIILKTLKLLKNTILFLILKILYPLLKFLFSTIKKIVKTIIKKTKIKIEEYKKQKNYYYKKENKIQKNNIKEKKENHYEPLIIIKKVRGDIKKFESLIYKKSSIGIILGARGTGKSALGLKILENYYYKNKKENKKENETKNRIENKIEETNKKIIKEKNKTDKKEETTRKLFALGFENSNLPYYIQKIRDPVFLEENSIVLLDESGITFSSRKGFSDINTLMSELILISRHKNLSLIFITQNSSNLDVNILRQADYLMLKPSSLLQLDFERKKIKKIYEKIKEDFETYKNIKGITYIYSEEFEGFIKNKLPSFWNENISKSFKNKTNKKTE